MTFDKESLRIYGESLRVCFTEEQEAVILEMFGEEPQPFEWREEDIYEQIMLILHGCHHSPKPSRNKAPASSPKVDYSTRKKRRAAVREAMAILSAVRDAEQRSLENVPENFQNSESYETGEYAVDNLEEIIDMLVDVY
jgi:hypothetical protein